MHAVAMKKSKEGRCQCCNKSLAHDYHLVFGDEGKRQNIAALLFDYIKKSLNENDGLRYAICNPCWQQLIQYNEFQQKCMRANEASSDDEDAEEPMQLAVKDESVDDSFDSIKNDIQYESEYLDDCPSESDIDYEMDDMKIEYLDENDAFDDENICNQDTTEKKKLPFDFTSVLVKPFFILGIENPDDLIRIKQKISTGIPRHSIEKKIMNNQNLDVEKIATSDDLINILEDDYRNETAYPKQARGNEQNNEIDLTDVQHADINEYLKSIAAITYEESYENYINCMLCSEVIMSQQHLIYHISECHTVENGVLCVFDESCPPFDDLVLVQEHMFQEHVDLIPTQLCLTCQTCDNSFKSSVQFGKHMCLSIEDESVDFQCVRCDKKLNSRKRYLFHTQFHLDNARPKVCIICELSFKNEETFYNHVMFSHERVFEYFCQECDKSFSSNVRLELHTRTHHTKRTIKCNSCDKTFVDKNMLDEHVSSKHSVRSEKTLECSVCKKVYNRSSRLRKHMTTHERLQKSAVLVCEPCSMAFAGIEDIDDHCNRSHDDDHVNITKKEILFVVCCEYCEFAFTDNQKLVKHKESHLNDEKPFKCGFCMACYETYSKLKTHKNTHINQQVKFPVQRHYMCDVEDCWKRYRHWSDLLNHRKTVHLINPSIFKCNDCEQTFYQSWNFSYHKKTVHAITTVKCQVCDFECKNSYNLKSHQKKAHTSNVDAKSHDTKPKNDAPPKKTPEIDQYLKKCDNAMICNICNKQLATRNSARSHIEMIHFKIKNFFCGVCGKAFYLKKDYCDHLRLHTAETPYECSVCKKKFRTTSMLNDHRKSHSNNRPHSCPYCTSTFKRAYVLKNHIKQHIGVKGFPCTFVDCKKEYRTQWELNSHYRLKHSKPEPSADHDIEYIVHESTDFEFGSTSSTSNGNIEIQSIEELGPQRKYILNNEHTEVRKSDTSPKKKHKKNNQQIIYVMPGPTSEHDNLNSKQLIANSSEDDHNYLAQEIDTNIIYIIQPESNGQNQIETYETVPTDAANKPTNILLCNPNFDNMTIMDVGAIQTVDQDTQAIIS